jgi:hypothetical protein
MFKKDRHKAKSINLKKNIHSFNSGQNLVPKFEFRVSIGISLEVDCNEVNVTPNFLLLVTFIMSLEGVCPDLRVNF